MFGEQAKETKKEESDMPAQQGYGRKEESSKEQGKADTPEQKEYDRILKEVRYAEGLINQGLYATASTAIVMLPDGVPRDHLYANLAMHMTEKIDSNNALRASKTYELAERVRDYFKEKSCILSDKPTG